MRANTRGTFPDALLDPSEQLVEKCPKGLSWSESEAVPVKVWEETSIRSVAKAIVKYEFTIDDRKHIVVDENSFQHYHNFVSKVLGTYNDFQAKTSQS